MRREILVGVFAVAAAFTSTADAANFPGYCKLEDKDGALYFSGMLQVPEDNEGTEQIGRQMMDFLRSKYDIQYSKEDMPFADCHKYPTEEEYRHDTENVLSAAQANGLTLIEVAFGSELPPPPAAPPLSFFFIAGIDKVINDTNGGCLSSIVTLPGPEGWPQSNAGAQEAMRPYWRKFLSDCSNSGTPTHKPDDEMNVVTNAVKDVNTMHAEYEKNPGLVPIEVGQQ